MCADLFNIEKKDTVLIHQNLKIDCRIMISIITNFIYRK